jgi:hypothetical protein
LPPEVAKPLQEAQQAAGDGKFDQAIAAAKRAQAAARGGAKAGVEKLLSQMLNARAVKNLNSAMEGAKKPEERDMQQVILGFLVGEPQFDKKDLFGKPKPGVLSKIGTLLKEAWLFVIAFGFWLVAGLMYFTTEDEGTRKAAQALGTVGTFLIAFGPVVAGVLGWIGKTLGSIPIPDQYGRYHPPTPNCQVSGCGSSAYYVLNPQGFGEVKLCSTHSEELQRRLQPRPRVSMPAFNGILQAVADLEEASKLEPGDSTVRQNLEQARQMMQMVEPDLSGPFDPSLFNPFVKKR